MLRIILVEIKIFLVDPTSSLPPSLTSPPVNTWACVSPFNSLLFSVRGVGKGNRCLEYMLRVSVEIKIFLLKASSSSPPFLTHTPVNICAHVPFSLNPSLSAGWGKGNACLDYMLQVTVLKLRSSSWPPSLTSPPVNTSLHVPSLTPLPSCLCQSVKFLSQYSQAPSPLTSVLSKTQNRGQSGSYQGQTIPRVI